MLSSSVSTSTARPLWLKWYQYSSIEPSEAISRSAMSRASGALWSSFSGSTQPSAETPVRITSIGCVAAGSASSTRRTASGTPRIDFSFAL